MTKEDCRDCACLVCGKKGEWICDECEKEITLIEKCPEAEEQKEFCVVIHEVLSRSETVKAKSSEEAKEKVRKMYYDGDIVLSADDFAYREMRDYDNDDDFKVF